MFTVAAHVHVFTSAQLRDAIIIVGGAVVKRERTNVTNTSFTYDGFAHLEDDGPVNGKILEGKNAWVAY